MIIIVHGPPASGKTTLARRIREKLGFPHISRDILQEWMSTADSTGDEHIRRFCADAGYQLMFDLAGELARGSGSFILEGCMNPDGAGARLKDKLEGSNHEIVEIFLTAPDDVLVRRYLQRGRAASRHSAHGDESSRGEALARHLTQVTYRPLGIGKIVIEGDGSQDLESATKEVLEQLETIFASRHNAACVTV
jgi:adenylate kinase family enzyme